MLFLISTLAIKLIKRNRNKIVIKPINNNSNENNKCDLSTENAKIKLAHLILTRFIFEFEGNKVFQKLIYSEAYIKNGMELEL